jgi:hypothetical protein
MGCRQSKSRPHESSSHQHDDPAERRRQQQRELELASREPKPEWAYRGYTWGCDGQVWVTYDEPNQRALEAAHSAFKEGSCTLTLVVGKKPGRFAKRGRQLEPERQVVEVRFKTMTQVKKGAAVFADKRDVRRRIVQPHEQIDQERVETLR